MNPRAGCLCFVWLAITPVLWAQPPAPAPKTLPAAPSAEKFAPYFRAPQTERAALSPDGRHLAFTVHKGTELFLHLLEIDNPAGRKTIAVSDDFWAPEYSTGTRQSGREEKIVARVEYLRWVTPTRVVFSSNEGRVFAVDANGGNPKVIATPKDIAEDTDPFAERSVAPRLRRPRVIDTHAGPAGQVLITAYGRSMELFHGNLTTGALKSSEILPGRFFERDYLFDHQGHLRMRFYSRDRPQYYEHEPVTGRPKKLDALVDPAAGLSFKVTPENYLGSRSIPVGFGYDPNVLYYSSNVGRDTYGVYALDLQTGKPTGFKIEHPHFDLGDPDNVYFSSMLALDRHRRALAGVRFTGIMRATWWLDDELAHLQSEIEKRFPRKTVEIVDWDEARARFLLTITSTSDPGTWFVFLRKEGRLVEFAQRSPWIGAELRNPGGAFEFKTASGARISGYLTLPQKARVERAPLVVYCRENAWGRQWPSFNAQVQALAAMGYAVLQVNHRGCEGFGTAHRTAFQDSFDRVAAEDIVASIDWISAREKINPKLTAIFGVGFGGYYALRAMELFPDRFRCGMVVNPQTDLAMLLAYTQDGQSMRGDVYRAVFGKDTKRLDAISAVKQAAHLTQPLLIVRNKLREEMPADVLRSALNRLGRKPEVLEVGDEFLRGPEATAKAFEQIEGFLNLNVYRFGAEAGETKVVQ